MIPDKKKHKYNLEIPGVNVVNLWESVPGILYQFRLLLFIISIVGFLFHVKKKDILLGVYL
jgi:hypothetical protein